MKEIYKNIILKGKIMKTLIMSGIVILFFALTTFSQNNIKTISGTVTDNVRPCGYIKSDDGQEYKIHLGPVWYWNDNNYELKLSSVQIKGYIDGTDIWPYEIIQDGKTMKFADDNGNPLWSNGKGNKKGNGWGKGNKGNCWRNK
jgi:hypothetical protein